MPSHLAHLPPVNLAEFSKINNSGIARFRTCGMSYYLTLLLPSKAAISDNTDITAGGAYAAGLEATRLAYFYYQKPEQEAISIGRETLTAHYGNHIALKAGKTLERVQAGFESYFKRWPLATEIAKPLILDADGTPGIELEFLVEIPDLLNKLTLHPIQYFGRLDSLVTYSGGIYVLDDKTTTAFKEGWSSNWIIDAQMRGYTWAVRQSGYHALGSIIRGTALQVKAIKHEQSLCFYSNDSLNVWLGNVTGIIKQVMDAIAFHNWTYAFDWRCTNCPFNSFCALPTEGQKKFIALNRDNLFKSPA